MSRIRPRKVQPRSRLGVYRGDPLSLGTALLPPALLLKQRHYLLTGEEGDTGRELFTPQVQHLPPSSSLR